MILKVFWIAINFVKNVILAAFGKIGKICSRLAELISCLLTSLAKGDIKYFISKTNKLHLHNESIGKYFHSTITKNPCLLNLFTTLAQLYTLHIAVSQPEAIVSAINIISTPKVALCRLNPRRCFFRAQKYFPHWAMVISGWANNTQNFIVNELPLLLHNLLQTINSCFSPSSCHDLAQSTVHISIKGFVCDVAVVFFWDTKRVRKLFSFSSFGGFQMCAYIFRAWVATVMNAR